MRKIHGRTAVMLISLLLVTYLPAWAQTNPYFPLEAGLHFSYTTSMDGSPEEYVTITGTEQFHGTTAWAFQWDYSNSTDSRVDFYSIAPDGDVLFLGTRTVNPGGDVVEYVPNPSILILDMPLSVGHSWTVLYSVDQYLNGTFDTTVPGYSFNGEIIALGSFVSVPAGFFAALEVAGVTLIDDGVHTLRNNTWYALDVGVVRRESSTDGVPGVTWGYLWSGPLGQEDRSWGSVKALFR